LGESGAGGADRDQPGLTTFRENLPAAVREVDPVAIRALCRDGGADALDRTRTSPPHHNVSTIQPAVQTTSTAYSR
jgi:hypothetical protein